MGYIQYFCTYQRDGSSGGFQCVDTLVFVLKHAEGMSLRCDAPSPIVAGMNHRILSRLTRIQRDDYSWEFVADYLEHGLHGLYGYVGFVESC